MIKDLQDAGEELSIKEITNRFIAAHGEDYERKITPHWIGQVIRRKLGIKAERHNGNYSIASYERAKLESLFARYGVGGAQKAKTENNLW